MSDNVKRWSPTGNGTAQVDRDGLYVSYRDYEILRQRQAAPTDAPKWLRYERKSGNGVIHFINVANPDYVVYQDAKNGCVSFYRNEKSIIGWGKFDLTEIIKEAEIYIEHGYLPLKGWVSDILLKCSEPALSKLEYVPIVGFESKLTWYKHVGNNIMSYRCVEERGALVNVVNRIDDIRKIEFYNENNLVFSSETWSLEHALEVVEDYYRNKNQ